MIEFIAALCALALPTQFAVADSYREPTCTWCAGNRGIEFATPPKAPVYSAVSGEVTFAGSVAGSKYVVVRGPGGVLVTHGRLESFQVQAGDRVTSGFRIGASSGDLYIGVRLSGVYLDPTSCAPTTNSPSGLRPRAVLVPIHSHRP